MYHMVLVMLVFSMDNEDSVTDRLEFTLSDINGSKIDIWKKSVAVNIFPSSYSTFSQSDRRRRDM